MSRRRGRYFATMARGDVRAAYAAQLRAQWQGRPAWSHFGRIVDRLERGEAVTVPAWAVGRFTGWRAATFGGPEHAQLQPDGSVVPVEPVRSPDGLRITGWRKSG